MRGTYTLRDIAFEIFNDITYLTRILKLHLGAEAFQKILLFYFICKSNTLTVIDDTLLFKLHMAHHLHDFSCCQQASAKKAQSSF